MIKPTSGWTLIETIETGGLGLITADGEKLGTKKENVVIAVSEKDGIEWKKGDKVALGEGAKGFEMNHGNKEYKLIGNSFIIAVL